MSSQHCFMQGGPLHMGSQMHWDGYSLPSSQLPYAIPAQPLPPYGYHEAMDAGYQVRAERPMQRILLCSEVPLASAFK